MQEVQVKEVARREKGRVFFRFDNGTEFTLYRSEIRGLPQAESTLLMTEDAYLPVSLYEKILTEIVGKRAKKRALFLLCLLYTSYPVSEDSRQKEIWRLSCRSTNWIWR